jgi:ribosomal protein L19E
MIPIDDDLTREDIIDLIKRGVITMVTARRNFIKSKRRI